jgi:hypothetical protein
MCSWNFLQTIWKGKTLSIKRNLNWFGLYFLGTGGVSDKPRFPFSPGSVLDKFCYRLNDRGFESQQGLGIFLFTTASKPALVPTQPPIQWVLGAISLEVKRPGREANHSPPSTAKVKNEWGYTSTPPVQLYGMVLS